MSRLNASRCFPGSRTLLSIAPLDPYVLDNFQPPRLSGICINLGPFRPDLLILCLRSLAIGLGSLKTLSSQTLVDCGLRSVAHSHRLPQKPSCMTFIQQVHDFLTSFAKLARSHVTHPLLDNITYLGCPWYADEDACWAKALIQVVLVCSSC